MTNIFVSTVIGIASSIISSLIWLYFFSMLRPKIDISPEIAKDANTSDGRPAYIIKIINRNRRSTINVKVKLSLLKPFFVPNGQVNLETPIPLKINEIFSLKGFDNKDKDAEYVFRFVTYEDLESLWSDDEAQFLIVNVHAIDSLSGLGKFFERKYMMKRNSIKEGTFVFGNTFEIK